MISRGDRGRHRGRDAVFAGDLTKDGVCDALVQAAVDEFGALDIVVNNAGYTWDGMAHKMSDEQFRAMLEIHTVVAVPASSRGRSPPARASEAGARGGPEVFRRWST